MEKDNNKNANSSIADNNVDFNPKNRDFQRTENDIDDISKSEKEELEIRKQRTHNASTTPDKNHVG